MERMTPKHLLIHTTGLCKLK